MGSFFQLLRKELFMLRWFIVPLTGLSILWHLFLMTKMGVWDEGLVIGLGLMPISFIPLWILITSFIVYRNEWNEDTIYFMLALPVNAWQVTLTKLLAVVIGAAVGTAVIGLGFFSVALRSSIDIIGELSLAPTGWIAYNGMLLIVFSLAMLIAGVMVIQASYIISRMANRLHGLVLIWIFLLISWLIPHLSILIEPLLRWLPSIKVIGGSSSFNGVFTTQNIWIPLGLIIAPLLVVFGFFALATWLWQSQIELA